MRPVAPSWPGKGDDRDEADRGTDGTGSGAGGGRCADPDDGHAGARGCPVACGAVRTDRSVHPGARGTVQPVAAGGHGYEAPASGLRQHLVRAERNGQHWAHHRTGRGAWHAESIGAEEIAEGRGDAEFRSVLFWVNLARKDKDAEPTAKVLDRDRIPQRREGDAIVRTLVGEGSPIRLGTPASIVDVELPHGGAVTLPVPREYQGFAYLLDGEATFGSNARRAVPPQLVLLGEGDALTTTQAEPGTRFMLMTGEPYGETPIFNGPFVD